jgi:hypothetical protein
MAAKETLTAAAFIICQISARSMCLTTALRYYLRGQRYQLIPVFAF